MKVGQNNLLCFISLLIKISVVLVIVKKIVSSNLHIINYLFLAIFILGFAVWDTCRSVVLFNNVT